MNIANTAIRYLERKHWLPTQLKLARIQLNRVNTHARAVETPVVPPTEPVDKAGPSVYVKPIVM